MNLSLALHRRNEICFLRYDSLPVFSLLNFRAHILLLLVWGTMQWAVTICCQLCQGYQRQRPYILRSWDLQSPSRLHGPPKLSQKSLFWLSTYSALYFWLIGNTVRMTPTLIFITFLHYRTRQEKKQTEIMSWYRKTNKKQNTHTYTHHHLAFCCLFVF